MALTSTIRVELSDELPYARWLIEHLTRDERGRLVIAPASHHIVSARIRQALSSPFESGPFLDQVLRLAEGASSMGGEVYFARSLVRLVLDHLPRPS